MNAISINNHEIGVKEYSGQRVVTFKDIDLAHVRPSGTAKRNFNKNKKHFLEGEDYHIISRNDVGTNFVPTYGFSQKAASGTIITETGYLMLVKSFTDDLAWDVQRQLVKCYFRGNQQPALPEVQLPDPEPYEPYTFRRAKVMKSSDVAELFGVSIGELRHGISGKKLLINGFDYKLLRSHDLRAFKTENNEVNSSAGRLTIIYYAGVLKLMKYFELDIKEEIDRIFSGVRHFPIKDQMIGELELPLYDSVMLKIMDEMSAQWDYSRCDQATDEWFRAVRSATNGPIHLNEIAEKITASQAAWEESGFMMGFKAATMLFDRNRR